MGELSDTLRGSRLDDFFEDRPLDKWYALDNMRGEVSRPERWAAIMNVLGEYSEPILDVSACDIPPLSLNAAINLFSMNGYTQSRTQVSNDIADFLLTSLNQVYETYSMPFLDFTGQFWWMYIAPFIDCLGAIFGDDLHVEQNARVVAKSHPAQASFDCLIRRRNRCIGITKTGIDNDGLDIARNLFSCEVLADSEQGLVIFGVTTDSSGWYIVDSSERSLHMDIHAMNECNPLQVVETREKLVCMLSDDCE